MANAQVNLVFTADTSVAKRQLQDLQNTLSNLTKNSGGNSDIFNLSPSIQKATQAAAQLKATLTSATDVKTGQLDLSKFARGLEDSGMSLSKYRQQLEQLGPQGAKAFADVAKSVSTAQVPIQKATGLLHDFGITLKNTAKWQISSSLLHGFMGAIQNAWGYAQDLNESLNNIRIVTGYGVDKMAQFAVEANKAAKALSTTTTNYTDASLIYYQQGLSDKEVKERTDVTVKLANVARESATTVSDQMTAVWNNFADGSKSLEYYADVITKLGAATAASNSEIAEGIEKFAAISHTVGLSYEYATSALTTVVDRTRQSADVVGTAFKTMFARIQGLKLGETLDDGTTLNQYSQALKAVEIDIKNSNGELKDMDVILDEMGAKWKDLNRDEQVALAQKVAGVRQYQQLISLMENYDFFKENVELARDSEGALQEQADIYAESWEAARKRVKASMETIYQNLINDEGFIHLTQGLAKVLDLVGDFIKSIGGLKGVLFALGAVAVKVFQQDIAKGIESMKLGIFHKTREANKQKQAMQQKEEAAAELGKMSVNSGTNAGAMTADAYKEQSEMQLAIIQNAEHLDEVQLSQLNTQMKVVESLHEQAIAAGEVADQAERSAEAAKAQVAALNIVAQKKGQKELISSNTVKMLENVNTDLGKATTRMGSLNKLGSQLGPNMDQGLKLGKKSLQDMLQRTRSDIDNIGKTLGQNIDLDLVDENTLASIKNLSSHLDKVEEQINNIKASDDGTFDGASKGAEDLASELKVLNQEFIEVTEQIQALNIDTIQQVDLSVQGGPEAAQALNQVIQSSQQAGEALGQVEEKSAGASAGVEQVVKSAKNLQSNANNTQAIVGAVGQSIMTLGMVVSTVTSIIDTFMNPDTTGMDKAKALIMGLLGLAPMIIGTVNSISTAITTAGVEGSLAWLWVTLAVAGVAALVAITISIVQAVSNAPTELEKKIKTLEEIIDSMKQASEDVKSEIEGIKSAIDGYDDAVAKLQECTRGTQEWDEALKEVNQSVLNLMREYPELAGIQGAFDYDSSTGMRTINKDVVNDYLNQKQMQASTMDAATMRKEAELAQTYAENDKTVLAQNIAQDLYNKQDFNNTDYHTDQYGNFKNYQSTNEIQKRLQENLLSLSGLSPDEMKEKLEKIFPEESFGDEFIESLVSYAGDIDNLSATTEAAALQMQTASELVAQSNIKFENSDYENNISGAITKMAAGQYDQTYATEYDKVLNTVQGFSQTGQNGTDLEVKNLWDEFNKAQGTNYELDKNAIRGNKNKRELAYKEDGETKFVSAEYIATTIATSKALEEMGASADQARQILGEIDFDSDKLNTEINKYLSSGNMAEMSQKDLEILQTQEDLGEYLKESFGGTENLQAYADMLGKSIDEVIADFENSMSEAEKAFAEAMEGFSQTVQKQFAEIDDEVKKEMNVGQQKQLAELMQQAFDNQGREASQLVADMFTSFGENADEVITMIQDIDFDSATIVDYEKAIAEAGLTGIITASQLQTLAGAIKDLGAISDLTKLQTNYAEKKKITSGLETGDTISTEDWATLNLDSEIANQYFVEMADGTHRLIEDAQEFQQVINEVNLQPFKDGIKQINAEIDKYAGFEGENTYNTLNQNAETAAAFKNLNKNINNPDNYAKTFANTQLDYLEGANYQSDGFDISQLRDNLSAGADLPATYQAIAEAIAACGNQSELFGEKQKENQAEAEKLKEIVEQQEIADIIESSGLDEGLVRDTAEAFEGMADVLEHNEKLATQVAVRYLNLQDAVIDLSKNYDDYKDVLKDLKKASNDVDKAAIKNSDSYKGLQKSMAGLLGTSEKFVDNKLLEAIDPKDLDKASRGDEAAIERIRKKFVELQVEAAKANGIDLSGLQSELDKLKEGQVFDIDNTPFLKKLIEAQLAAGATAPEIQALLSGMDIDADVTPFEGSMEEMKAAAAEAGSAVVADTSFDQEVEATDVEQPTKAVDIAFEETITSTDHPKTNMVLKDGAEEAVQVDVNQWEYDKTVVPKKVEESDTETTPAKSVKTKTGSGKSGNVKGVQIKNAHKSTGSSVSNATRNTAGGNRSGGKKGGGGGGGGKSNPAEKKDLTKKSEVVDRYKKVEDKLKTVNKNMDKYNKLSDMAYGNEKVKSMNKILKLYEQEIKLQQRLIEEAEQYAKIDQKNLNKAAQEAGTSGLKFDKDGNVSNIENIQLQLFTKLNELEEKNNTFKTKEEQEAFEKETLEPYRKKIENFKDALSQYEETLEKMAEAKQTKLDLQVELMSKKLEKANYKVRLRIEFRQDEMVRFEKELEKLENRAFSTAKVMKILNAEFKAQKSIIAQSKAGVKNALKNGLYMEGETKVGYRQVKDNEGNPVYDKKGNPKMEKYKYKEMVTFDDWMKSNHYSNARRGQVYENLINGKAPKGWDDINTFFGEWNLTEEGIEALREFQSTLLDTDEALDKIKETVDQSLLKTFEHWQNIMERNMRFMDHWMNNIDTWEQILDVLGRKNVYGYDASSQFIIPKKTNNPYFPIGLGKASFEQQLAMGANSFQEQRNQNWETQNKNVKGQYLTYQAQKDEYDRAIPAYHTMVKANYNKIEELTKKTKTNEANRKKYKEEANEEITDLKNQYKNATDKKEKVKLKEQIQDLRKARDEGLAGYDELISSNKKEIKALQDEIETTKDGLYQMKETVQKSREELYADLLDLLQKAKENTSAYIDDLMKSYESWISGVYGSVENMQDAFEKNREISERYVGDYEKVYELTKLNRDLEKRMDETSNLKAKQKLAEYQEKILKYAKEGVKVSQYDLDVMQREYDLEVAKIALEEAQNAKTQVRLTRDSEGNYSYTYTADESKTAEAEQNYEDKLNDLIKFNNEYQIKMQEQSLGVEKQLQDTLANLKSMWEEGELTQEQYLDKAQQASAYYAGQMQYYARENEKASMNNATTWITEYDAYYGTTKNKILISRQFTDDEVANQKKIDEVYENAQIERDKNFFKLEEWYKKHPGETKQYFDDMKQYNQDYTDDIAQTVELEKGQRRSASDYFVSMMERNVSSNDENLGKIMDGNAGLILNTQQEFLPGLSDNWTNATDIIQGHVDALTDGEDNDSSTLLGSINKGLTNYENQVGESLESVGIDLEEGKTPFQQYGEEAENQFDRASRKSDELLEDLEGNFEDANEDFDNAAGDVEDWYNETYPHWDNAKEKIDAVTTAITELIGAAADIEPIEIDVDTEEANTKIQNLKDELASLTGSDSNSGNSGKGSGNSGKGSGNSGKGSGNSGKGSGNSGDSGKGAGDSGKGSGDKKGTTQGDGKLQVGDKVIFKTGPYYENSWGQKKQGNLYEGQTVIIDKYSDSQYVTGGKKHTSIGDYYIHISGPNGEDLGWVKKSQISGYDTGGYTGKWGLDGRLAMLHQKELVLNQTDTENMLAAVKTVREIAAMVDLQAQQANLAGQYALALGQLPSSRSASIDQNVHITAEFPNVQDHNEVELAITSLVNRASQFAWRN